MLEIGACMEMKAKSSELVGSTDSESEFTDISFEELLAQEKKDSFWSVAYDYLNNSLLSLSHSFSEFSCLPVANSSLL